MSTTAECVECYLELVLSARQHGSSSPMSSTSPTGRLLITSECSSTLQWHWHCQHTTHHNRYLMTTLQFIQQQDTGHAHNLHVAYRNIKIVHNYKPYHTKASNHYL